MLIKLLFSLVHRKKRRIIDYTGCNCFCSFRVRRLKPLRKWWNILIIGFFMGKGPHYFETFYNKLILARRVWDSHESARLSLNKGGQGSISAPCRVWFEFVAGSRHVLMVSRRRALRISSLSSTKTNISNSKRREHQHMYQNQLRL